jgi:hypothetical protein
MLVTIATCFTRTLTRSGLAANPLDNDPTTDTIGAYIR